MTIPEIKPMTLGEIMDAGIYPVIDTVSLGHSKVEGYGFDEETGRYWLQVGKVGDVRHYKKFGLLTRDSSLLVVT